jgi:hypothetical protein
MVLRIARRVLPAAGTVRFDEDRVNGGIADDEWQMTGEAMADEE